MGEVTPSFTYDAFGNRIATKVGNRTLSTNSYMANNGSLVGMTYGNGDTVAYTYDDYGNIATMSYNGEEVVKNFSDSGGNINRTQDLLTNLEHRVTYDSTGRLVSKETLDLSTSGDKWLRSLEYDYDVNNNVTKFAVADKNGSSVTTFVYGKDNLPTSTTLPNEKTITYDYDNLGRLLGKELVLDADNDKKLTSTYTYVDSERGTVGSKTYTTTKLETETVGDTTYKYTYDAVGNIQKIFKVNSDDSQTTLHRYYYDNYNQLTRDMDGENGVVVDYTYDDSGNIVSKVTRNWNNNFSSPVIGSVVSNITYSYTDSEWKDLLTSYNGQTLTYDNIGNPLNYRDGITLTWQNGRELASYADATQSITYTYDAGGLRTGKTVTASSGATTNYSYVYENGLLLKMTRGSRSLEFNYDALGTPVSIKYKSSASATPVYYYYGLNSRGDVVSLYNSDGSVAAIYTYDAYGKLLGVKNPAGIEITSATSIANLNPLRYRGYVYDNETGLYYLQSRYYDPTTCRFINGDGQLNIDSFNGFNQFAYCNNNSVNLVDFTGTDAIVLVDTDKLGHIGALVQDKYGKWWHFYWGASDSSSSTNSSASLGIKVTPHTWCNVYTGGLDVSSINKGGGFSGYDDSVYLYGDFSSCISELQNPSGEYHLYKNNCSQVTLRTLSKADTIYADALQNASAEVLPERAFDNLTANLPVYEPPKIDTALGLFVFRRITPLDYHKLTFMEERMNNR